MELTNMEIDILINNYEGEIDQYGWRIDQVCYSTDYDNDLKSTQIDRLKKAQERAMSRVEELKKLHKEL